MFKMYWVPADGGGTYGKSTESDAGRVDFRAALESVG